MRTKTEALYNNLLSEKIVTFDEVVQNASNILGKPADRRYINRKYVRRLVKAGKLQPIRKGLYAVLNPLEETKNHETYKLLIASKIRRNYYLGFHTALEYYGSAYSAFNEAYVCIQPKDRFNPFTYDHIEFKPVFTKDTTSQIHEKPYGKKTLRVSSKERTFIECIDRVQYAGGWEECTKSLAELRGIDFQELTTLTIQNESQTLTRKTGYMLELLKNTSPFYEHIDEKHLTKLEDQVNGQPQYLERGNAGNLNTKWRLYIPEEFEEKLKGI